MYQLKFRDYVGYERFKDEKGYSFYLRILCLSGEGRKSDRIGVIIEVNISCCYIRQLREGKKWILGKDLQRQLNLQ